jgi:hypothetical protein
MSKKSVSAAQEAEQLARQKRVDDAQNRLGRLMLARLTNKGERALDKDKTRKEAARLLKIGAKPDCPIPEHPREHTPLQLAVSARDVELVELMLDHGGQPNLFISGVTALGISAYVFCLPVLEAMARRGADTALLLLPAHTEEAEMHGSTLLHRVMARPADGRDDKKAAVALFLAERELARTGQPFPLTHQGKSPLDVALEDEAAVALRAWFAKRVEAPAIAAAAGVGESSAQRQAPRL